MGVGVAPGVMHLSVLVPEYFKAPCGGADTATIALDLANKVIRSNGIVSACLTVSTNNQWNNALNSTASDSARVPLFKH